MDMASNIDHQMAKLPLTVDKTHVHKRHDENAFIETVRFEERHADGSLRFHAKFRTHTEHPFYFERPRNHIPGMYLVEGGRQFCIAIGHLFFEIPMDHEFVLESLNIEFHNFANLADPVDSIATMSQIQWRRNTFSGGCFGGTIRQNGQTLLSMNGNISVISRRMLQRLERQSDKHSSTLRASQQVGS